MALGGIVLIVVSLGIALWFGWHEYHKPHWQPLDDYERPFCHYCGRRFLAARGVAWHIQASHPQAIEEEDWKNAAKRERMKEGDHDE